MLIGTAGVMTLTVSAIPVPSATVVGGWVGATIVAALLSLHGTQNIIAGFTTLVADSNETPYPLVILAGE